MLDAVEGKYMESRTEVSDNFSGIFNVAGGFGQIVGPSVAGALEDRVGFNMTFDIIALSVLAYVVIYILFCDGIRSMGRSLRATLLRCRKRSGEANSPTSPSRKLLEETTDEEEDISPTKNESYEIGMNGSYVSTDTSFNHNNSGYAINKE